MRNRSLVIAMCVSVTLAVVLATPAAAQPRFNVLVFSKVNGLFHDSIPAGKQAITELGAEHGFGAQLVGHISPGDWVVTSPRPATLRLRIPAGAHKVRGDAQPLVVTVDGQRVGNGGVQLATNGWGWNQFTVDGGASGRVVDLTFSSDIAIVVEKTVEKAAT